MLCIQPVCYKWYLASPHLYVCQFNYFKPLMGSPHSQPLGLRAEDPCVVPPAVGSHVTSQVWEFPWWLSRLGICPCHCSGLGCNNAEHSTLLNFWLPQVWVFSLPKTSSTPAFSHPQPPTPPPGLHLLRNPLVPSETCTSKVVFLVSCWLFSSELLTPMFIASLKTLSKFIQKSSH